MDLAAIQRALREQKLDAWLFYDHHHRDPIAGRILGLDPHAHITRRWFYLIPADGEPRKLVHRIESGRLDSLPGTKQKYSSWAELEEGLEQMLAPYKTVAMQYSPRNTIMYISLVDAGMVELIRGMGKEVVTSANLVSHFEAVLTEAQIASHYEAQRKIDVILAEGFREMGRRVRARSAEANEFAMVEWLSEAMSREKIVWENGPNVSVNENSSDSHYEPTRESSKAIKEGDFVLIDIWGRMDREDSVYYDITWTGVVAREPSEREELVFATVAAGRDAAIKVVEDAFKAGRPIAGWEADDAARKVINEAGFAEYFTHRTGHNIAHDIHGNGANLDNLETHDDRLILPNTCFSVEPGIYLPEFGVRSEIDMMTSARGAKVTGRMQEELVRI
jgi:Xaa-Pro dipeptidase